MALICAEREEMIWKGEGLFAAVHPLGEGYALSGLAVRDIPEGERCPRPREGLVDGLDIHAGSSTVSTGTYSMSDFRKGKFLFSISEETAQRYLPKTLRRIHAEFEEA
jgi:hypothetical protein